MTNNSRYQPRRDNDLQAALHQVGLALANSPIDLPRAKSIGMYLRQALDIYHGWAGTVGRPAVACPRCHTPIDQTWAVGPAIVCGQCGTDLAIMEVTL